MSALKGDIRYCRSCYDHLAGYVGVKITEQLIRLHFIARKGEKDFELTAKGTQFLNENGFDVSEMRKKNRSFSRGCIDGSERKPHLAGSVGAAFLELWFRRGWLERVGDSRVIRVTSLGSQNMAEKWRLEL